MSDQFNRDDLNRPTDAPFGAANTPSAEQPSTAVPPVPDSVPTPPTPPAPPVTPYAAASQQPAPSAYPPVPPAQGSAPMPQQAAPMPQQAAPAAQQPAPAAQSPYAPSQQPYAQQPVPPQPPVYQPPYAAAPNYYAPMQPPKKTNGFAVASLICGIVAVPAFCCIWIPIVLGVLAIVFGILSRRQDERMSGMAIAGIICGAVGLTLAVLCLIGYYNGSLDWVLNDYDDWMYEFGNSATLFRR